MTSNAEETEKLLAFLNAKQPRAGCTFCGSTDLQIASTDKSGVESAGEYAIAVWGELAQAMPVYMVVCGNCGHAHSFAKKMIEKLIGNGDKKRE